MAVVIDEWPMLNVCLTWETRKATLRTAKAVARMSGTCRDMAETPGK
jgi:hypothetical protein